MLNGIDAERDFKGSGYLSFVFLEKPLYAICNKEISQREDRSLYPWQCLLFV